MSKKNRLVDSTRLKPFDCEIYPELNEAPRSGACQPVDDEPKGRINRCFKKERRRKSAALPQINPHLCCFAIPERFHLIMGLLHMSLLFEENLADGSANHIFL